MIRDNPGMELVDAIRTRRTVKAFSPQPVDRQSVLELLELARWAPNHRLTGPWRFRVVGTQALSRLKTAAANEAVAAAGGDVDLAAVRAAAAAKLERAPTLVVCSAVEHSDPLQSQEDRDATAVAAYIVLLAAHDRGLVGYWRTPSLLRTAAGRSAVALGDNEQFVGLLHLGFAADRSAAATTAPPVRSEASEYVEFLP